MVRCAGTQGKFWEMRDRLFANPQSVGQAATHVEALGLDAKRFDACMGGGLVDAEIRKDMAQAEALGVEGTPSFLLAAHDSTTGKLKPVKLIVGAQPFANFKADIDKALEEQKH